MSLDLFSPGTTPQRPDQLSYRSKAILELVPADLKIALTASGGADLTTFTTRCGHTATFARSTAGLYVSRGGLLRSVFTNFPGLQYDVANGTLGLLLQAARTQLIASLDISAATNIGSPDTTAVTGPGHSISGYQITDNDAGAAEGEQIAVTFTTDAVKAIAVCIKKGTATASQLVLRDTTAPADRLNATVTWSGTNPATPSTSTGTYLGKIQLENDWWVLLFATASVTAANTNVLQLYGATTTVSTTGTTLWAAPLAENAVYPGMVKTASLAQGADSLFIETKTPPIAMTGYLRAINRGSSLAANDTRLEHWGLTNATTDPRLVTDVQGGLFRLLHDNGSAEVSSTLAAAPTLGQVFELRRELFADGSVRLHQSIAGAAETSAAASAANALGTTWGGAATARVYVNSDPAVGNAGHLEVLGLGWLPGTGFTMAQLRARFS